MTSRTGAAEGDGSPYYLCGPRIHEFLAEMHREVFDGRDGAFLTVGEMPGVTVEDARLFTDPARAEVDMVFQFEHVSLDQGATKWDVLPFRLPDLKASLGRWQDGLAEVGWNSLYWNNHDQPRVVSRFGDDGEYRVRSAKLLGTVLHLHRGTPYVYQGEELGMTNAPFAGIDDFRDIESVNHFRVATGLGADPDEVLARAAHDGPRQRPHADAVGRDRARRASPTGTPWIAVNPNHTEINAEAAIADPDSVFHHYRRLIELRNTEPAVAHGDFTMLLAGRPGRLRVHPPARRHRAARARQLLRRAGPPRRSRVRRVGWPASCCSATSRTRPGPSSRPGRRASTGGRWRRLRHDHLAGRRRGRPSGCGRSAAC